MKKRYLFALWAGLFILCAGCGFIPKPAGGLKVLLTVFSLVFFLPPALLLHKADREQDRDTLKLVRNLSALSLLVTLAVLVLNFLWVMGGETLGNVLHYMLVIVSTPMVCSGYWALSLFLWACLLMVSMSLLRRK